MEWVDVTTYSRGDKERTPRIWEIRVNRIRIAVHRYLHCREDQWFLSCLPFFDKYELPFTDIDIAKQEAIKLISLELKRIMKELKTITNKSSGHEPLDTF